MPKLVAIDLPRFGEAPARPEIPATVFAARHAALMARLGAAGLDAIVIYGDREHAGNIAWVTGHDPRFEEALYIAIPGRTPHLLVGNEGFGYAALARGVFKTVLWEDLSLMGQPGIGTTPLATLLAAAGLEAGMRIGLAGWKGFARADGAPDPDRFETPHYLVEALRRFGSVCNAASVFMNPDDGLRAVMSVHDILGCEYAASTVSNTVRSIIAAAAPGVSEIALSARAGFTGDQHSVHFMLSAGPRVKAGLGSPSGRKLERGDPIVTAYGIPGGLTARAGFLTRDANDLPPAIADYVERLAGPYFSAAVDWYQTIGIGVTGGALHAAVMARIGDPFFGVGLNPGHLIAHEEWLHSPVAAGSTSAFRSGMAVQCDIIPATGGPYYTCNVEDGVVLADASLREALAAQDESAWNRIQARRRFMSERLGITLRPEVLPLSNTPGWLPPHWLSPGTVFINA